MTLTYYVRPADLDDLDACFELRRLTEQQFRAAGIDQWHDSAEGRRVIYSWIDSDQMNVVTSYAGDVVACFALSGPDQDFWAADERGDPALYLYKLMIRPDRRGTGLGDAILDYACGLARQMDRPLLRIDCWKTNTGLHSYFEERGFEHVATRTAPGRNSGWLAERDTTRRTGDGSVHLADTPPPAATSGDRWDDPTSQVWAQARDVVAELDTDLDGVDIGARAAIDQAVRALDVRAREHRQRNGMTHRPYTGRV